MLTKILLIKPLLATQIQNNAFYVIAPGNKCDWFDFPHINRLPEKFVSLYKNHIFRYNSILVFNIEAIEHNSPIIAIIVAKYLSKGYFI